MGGRRRGAEAAISAKQRQPDSGLRKQSCETCRWWGGRGKDWDRGPCMAPGNRHPSGGYRVMRANDGPRCRHWMGTAAGAADD